MPNSPDDLAALKAERAAADREYNDALTRLDRAIQQLPAGFPPSPSGLDEHQITPLNTLWKIDVPRSGGGWRGRFVGGIAPGGVGQQEVLRRVDEVEERFLRAVRNIHAPHGDGDHLGAGRLAFLAGRIPRQRYANASSPIEGLVGR